MSDSSPRLDLPYLLPSQAQKHVTHNTALARLDMLVQMTAQAIGAQTPPADPEAGQVFALGASPTGDWAGEGGRLAVWDGVAWSFVTPAEGWRIFDLGTARLMTFAGGDWVPVAPEPQNLDGVGINTTSDMTNRLAVSAPATLLSHEGGDHRLKINRAAATDTASLLFQTGFAGHAEIGLIGDGDLAVKTSADGSSWTEALRIAAATGLVSGAAVQASATDVTAGRLARADYAYGPGNLLGAVAQSGGVPTGAVIERGTNANGTYVRLADGTQICTHKPLIKPASDATAGVKSTVWTFPAAFAAGSSGDISVQHCLQNSKPDKRGITTAAGISAADVTLYYHESAGSSADIKTFALAIGRWF